MHNNHGDFVQAVRGGNTFGNMMFHFLLINDKLHWSSLVFIMVAISALAGHELLSNSVCASSLYQLFVWNLDQHRPIAA